MRSPTLLVAAFVVTGMGILTALGAAAPESVLARPLPQLPAPHLGAGAGVLLVGVALLARALGRRRLLLLAAGLAALLGLVSLVRVSWFPAPAGTQAATSAAALLQLPTVAAIGVLLAGLGLLAPALMPRHRLAAVVTGSTGSTVALLATALLVGRLSGFLGTTATSAYTNVGASLYVLLALIVMGASLIRMAAGLDQPPAPSGSSWFPVATGIATAVTVVFIWRALVDNESDRLAQEMELASRLTAANVRNEVERLSNGLERVGRRYTEGSALRDSLLTAYMSGLVRDSVQALDAVGWQAALGADGRPTVEVLPPDSPDASTLRDLVRQENALFAPAVRFHALPDESARFALAVPLCGEAPCSRSLATLVDARALFRGLLADSLSAVHVSIRLDGTLVVQSSGTIGRADGAYTRDIDFPPGQQRWSVSVVPTSATIARAHSNLPNAVLVLGLTLALVLPLTLRLAETSWSVAADGERARLNAALESATDSLWVWSVPANTLERSAVLWKRLGYPAPAGAVPMAQWMSLVHPKDAPDVLQAMTRHATGASELIELEYRVQGADGRWHWLVERGRVVERSPEGGALHALGITADVTERKNADAALEASERKYRAVFDSASQMQALLDKEGRVVEMNPAGLVSNGVGRSGVAGAYGWELPAFRGSVAVREALLAGHQRGLARQSTSVVVRAENTDMGAITWDLSLTPIADADGTVVQLLLDARDITARKNAERALVELNNLATMGRLTARVAHEINNPLAGIQNSFSLIKGAVAKDHPHFRFVGAIDREIARIATVTRQLYETYRHEPESGSAASVDTVVSDAVAFIEQVNRQSRVRVDTDLRSAPPTVPFPDALLRRVIYNLVQNAVDASPPEGTIYLRAFEERGIFHLTVRDEGSGIPDEVRGRIFDPFMSTKGAEHRHGGMGLGLALVHGSVTAFGGRVSVHNAPGGGSQFEVSLPLQHPPEGSEST
ncbi:MAG: ATP-binding protein [Gemmatimonadaceae bacterium]